MRTRLLQVSRPRCWPWARSCRTGLRGDADGRRLSGQSALGEQEGGRLLRGLRGRPRERDRQAPRRRHVTSRTSASRRSSPRPAPAASTWRSPRSPSPTNGCRASPSRRAITTATWRWSSKTDSGITGLDSMKGKPIGAISTSTGEAWIKANTEKYGFGDYSGYNTQQDLLLDTQNGRVAGAVGDIAGFQFAFQQMPHHACRGAHQVGRHASRIMMQKGSPLLAAGQRRHHRHQGGRHDGGAAQEVARRRRRRRHVDRDGAGDSAGAVDASGV